MAEVPRDPPRALEEESPFKGDDDDGGEGPVDWEPDESGKAMSGPLPAGPADQAAAAPSLNSLVSRLPESNRDLLEELFRGKFIGVRKLDRETLR